VRIRRRDRGFTLLEVMVALAVLAASLMAVADLSGNALRNYVYARDLSVATLLARGKMAELEEKYEDLGFTDFDQTEDGNFAEQGEPRMTWRLDLRKPTSELTAEKILDGFLGGGTGEGDGQELLGKLLGGGAAGAGAGGAKGGPSSGVPGGILGGVLQGQIKAFAEELKKGVRQVTLRVSWKDGKVESGFDVSTYWVVLNPKAPGGARGQNPDIPPNLAGPAQLTRQPGVPALPGTRQPGTRTPRAGTGGGTQ
jgi:general secretion pathway protein I